MKRKALGRGIEALIPSGGSASTASVQQGSLREIDIDLISSNPYQPRSDFDAEKLGELANSIKQNGILQRKPRRTSSSGSNSAFLRTRLPSASARVGHRWPIRCAC